MFSKAIENNALAPLTASTVFLKTLGKNECNLSKEGALGLLIYDHVHNALLELEFLQYEKVVH